MIMESRANSSTVNLCDIDIEQLPSGKLCVNRIVLLCGMLAFNLLRTLKEVLPDRFPQETLCRSIEDLAEHRVLRRARDTPQRTHHFGKPVRGSMLLDIAPHAA